MRRNREATNHRTLSISIRTSLKIYYLFSHYMIIDQNDGGIKISKNGNKIPKKVPELSAK